MDACRVDGSVLSHGVVRRASARIWLAWAFVLVVFVVAPNWACSDGNADIDFSRPEVVADTGSRGVDAPRAEPLRIAVAPVLSAKATLSLYQQLADYLATRLARPVELVQGKTYAEINDLVKSGDITVALVCTNPYLQGQDDFGMELLAVPEIHGKLVYYSFLIVGRDSEAQSLNDLRGASFAFSDPLSNSGRLAPAYQLALLGANPDSFFSQTTFTYSHDSSVRAVADGVVTAAAVDSLVYDYLATAEPELIGGVKVIERWGPFGINPLVVNPRLAEQTKSDLRRVFLEMANDPEGHEILEKIEIDRFVVPDNSLYDSVREMRAYLRERGLAP